MTLELFCHVLGDPLDRVSSITIANTESVAFLKGAIKAQKRSFLEIDADALDLYQVSIPIQDFDAKLANACSLEQVEGSRKLVPTARLRNHFQSPQEDHIHVILQHPPKGECSLSHFACHS